MLPKWVTARWKIQETSSVFLVSSKWLQKSIILGKCAMHDYLIYRRVEELRVASWPSWSLCKKLKLGFLSVHYFDCSKYNCTCKLKSLWRYPNSSSTKSCYSSEKSHFVLLVTVCSWGQFTFRLIYVSYSDSCSSSCFDSSWWSSFTCSIIIFSVDWAEVSYTYLEAEIRHWTL